MASAARLAALRAMANQTVSTKEAAIAKEKLARYASFIVYVQTEQERAEELRRRGEDFRAQLVRKVEKGVFKGITIRAGAGGVDVKYR